MLGKALTFLLAAVVLAACSAIEPEPTITPLPTSPAQACRPEVAQYKARAENLMADYLLAHEAGRQTAKREASSALRDLDEPECIDGARAALLDWMGAVDAGGSLYQAEQRWFDALEVE